MDLLERRRQMMCGQDEYIVFADPEVERICVSNWGDGIGLTKRKAATITDLNEVFENSNITIFNEFKYFTKFNYFNNGGAFYNCTSLREITWPTTDVPNSCFEGCTSLTDIYFEKHIDSSVWSFTNCNSLVNIHFKNIHDVCSSKFNREDYHPFYASKNGHIFINGVELTNINVPDDITRLIGVFYCCKNITSVFLNNVTYIGRSTFYNCTGLVSIPDFSNITTIYNGAFEGCTNLEGDVFIPSGCSVEIAAFRGCRKIRNLIIRGTYDSGYHKMACSVMIANVGNGTGLFYFNGRFDNSEDNAIPWYFNKVIIDGTLYKDYSNASRGTISITTNNGPNLEAIYVNNVYQNNGNGSVEVIDDIHLKFISIESTIITNCPILRLPNNYSQVIVHLGSSSVAISPNLLTSGNINDKIDKIYVGDGSSQADDQLVLSRYLADPDWAQYSGKLDIWSNYNGEYKNRPTIPTQSNNS